MNSNIEQAREIIAGGGVVAMPTETVYGLAGNALSDAAVARIYELKGRPGFNPLIVHVASLAEAKRYGEFSAMAERLAEKFWPGPLTLVVRRTPDCPVSLLASAGLDTLALRVPAHKLAQRLLAACGLPLAAPSANRSGRISPTSPQHVCDEFGAAAPMILEGGDCEVGIESTVVDATGDAPAILRPGFVTREMLGAVCPGIAAQGGGAIVSPGMLASHYAPQKELRLNAVSVAAGEGLLAFGAPPAGAAIVENLSPSGDLREAAANLFRMLRRLDAGEAASIAAMPIPEEGLGIAINDRLKRAAH